MTAHPIKITPAVLSIAQKRMWMLYELNKGKQIDSDLFTLIFRFQGLLDVEALNWSIVEIARRHEILRTIVAFHDEEPVQHVLDTNVINLETNDETTINSHGRDQVIETVLHEFRQRVFSLEVGPLFRAKLIKFNEHEHVLILAIHQMVFDDDSISIFLKDMARLYEQFQQDTDTSSALPEFQYSDFSRVQRLWLLGDEYARELKYWASKLVDLPALDLTLDYPRPAVQTYNAAVQQLKLSSQLSRSLLKLGQQNDATLFMSLLSSLGLLISRYSGQTDVAIGTPVNYRDCDEWESVIGHFTNMLVMRLDYTGDGGFISLLERCRQTCLDAFSHQYLPFEKLIESSNLEYGDSRSPLFQVLFVLDTVQNSKPVLINDLEISFQQERGLTTKFDLEIYVSEMSDGLDINFVYNTDLFNAETINRMLAHYKNLLESIVMRPRQQASTLTLLDDSEKYLILKYGNQTKKDYPLKTTLAALFEQQVDKTPKSIAISFEGQTLSYRELDQRANQLAHYLQENNLGVGDYVSVFMERSLEMVITLYSILKTGAAYVPLDPEYPAERLGLMIDDTQSRLIITQSRLIERLPDNSAKLLCLESSDWESTFQSYNNSRLGPTASYDDTAYVIFTSSSTGKPKGVMNNHIGIINRLLWMQETFSLLKDDRVLQKTPYSFDVSVWEFFWPLLNGARLVIARPGGHKDPEYLSAILKQEAITTVHFVPSMLRVFLDVEDMSHAVALKRVICSGEALPFDLQQRFFKHSHAELHNLYGPTEAAIDVSHWHCRRHDERKIVPIGFPIANTSLYILDKKLQLVPLGVAGELHIGGIQVSKGYLNRKELTNEKFIADPYSEHAGRRLYKTGDRARYLDDGSIEFLGRMDNQVKLRGFRIELGEIESSLMQHEKVTAAVAIVRKDNPEHPSLVAYVTCIAENTFEEDVLRDYLLQRLPQYMVPSNIICLHEFPLSPNGKLNYRVLPCPLHIIKANKFFKEKSRA